MRNITGFLAGTVVLAAVATSTAMADQVIADDLIVQGSECVGLDCVNNESFGFDTLRLKENNTRIKFDDTSVGAFPSTDWQLTANDSASGGLNKFSIEDVTAASIPFTVEGAAPTNSLYVDSTGRVGLRTATPVLDLHVATSNTPAFRMEQNNAGGFTAQTWDIGGNEANFFVRDVTGGSRLSFRIRPGAPTSSIDINANGNVGIGTASPAEKIDVSGAGDVSLMLTRTDSFASGRKWRIKNNNATGRLTFGTDDVPTTVPFKLAWNANENLLRIGTQATNQVDIAGNLVITGTVTTSGSCNVGCDRVFDSSYNVPSIEDHAAAMWKEKHLPNVGPTAENVPFDVADKMGRMLNELEQAHIYIEQLNARLAKLEKKSTE
ncbi:MAG: hypothetical protein ABI451_06530 [Dokdonella sp.]